MEFIGNINMDEKLYQSRQIVICGAGCMLNELLDKMNQMNLLDKVVAICDNNQELLGNQINQIQVDSYEKVIGQYPEADYIAYNRFAVEICHQIHGNVRKIHLVGLKSFW